MPPYAERRDLERLERQMGEQDGRLDQCLQSLRNIETAFTAHTSQIRGTQIVWGIIGMVALQVIGFSISIWSVLHK